MAMTENQFQDLLATFRAKYDKDVAEVLDVYQAIKDGLASNTTGLNADQIAKIEAEFKEIMKTAKPVPETPELTGARAVLREGQNEDFEDESDFDDDKP